MARRKTEVKVVLHNEAFDTIHMSLAEALATIGARTLEIAHVPDAPPYGVGLVQTGAWAVFSGSTPLEGTADPPKAMQEGKALNLVVGYDFPARFNERGTVHQPARPFLDPAMAVAVAELPPEAKRLVHEAERRVGKRLGRRVR